MEYTCNNNIHAIMILKVNAFMKEMKKYFNKKKIIFV